MRPSPLPKFKCRVLIVDDVEDTREMYALYFTYLGWEVRLASDGAEGLAMARAEHPDFLVLDLAMPGMDGWEVGQHLKRDGVKTVAANPPHRLKEASRSRSEEFVPAEQIDFTHFEAPKLGEHSC